MKKERFKNPWFWIGVIAVAGTAVGANPESFNSWGALKEQVVAVLSNPYMLGCLAVAVLGVFVDPTTKGIKDGAK